MQTASRIEGNGGEREREVSKGGRGWKEGVTGEEKG